MAGKTGLRFMRKSDRETGKSASDPQRAGKDALPRSAAPFLLRLLFE
jgi:hypothetical protein